MLALRSLDQARRTLGEVLTVLKEIRPLLAGRPPEIQGAVLAQCVAIWVGGHHVEGDRAASRQLRAELLDTHLEAVRGLLALDEDC